MVLKMKSIQVAFWATLVCGSFGVLGSVEAKKVSASTADKAMTDCLLEADAENKESSGAVACCSKKLGICVGCSKIKTAGETPKICYIVDYGRNPFGTKPPRANSNGADNGGHGVDPDRGRPPSTGGQGVGGGGNANPDGGRPDSAGGIGAGGSPGSVSSGNDNSGNGGIN